MSGVKLLLVLIAVFLIARIIGHALYELFDRK